MTRSRASFCPVQTTQWYRPGEPTALDSPMISFQQLDAWKTSHELVLAVYEATDGMSDRETGIRRRLRQVAVLAPAKLAHGSARPDRSAFPRNVGLALGFLSELGYYLRFAHARGALPEDKLTQLQGLRGRAVFYTWRLFEKLTAGHET